MARLTYTLEQLRRLADVYCAATGMHPNALGRAICGTRNWAVIPRLMQGHGCQASTAERASEYFDAHWRPGVAWPIGVPRANGPRAAVEGTAAEGTFRGGAENGQSRAPPA